MHLILRYVYSFLFLLISTLSFGQKLDSLFRDTRVLNGIRVGTDVAGIVYGLITKNETFNVTRYEVNGDLGIKGWFIAADIGRGTFARNDGAVFNYKSSGTYVRLGADYRISKSANSFLFIGGRICQALYSEKGNYIISGIGIQTEDKETLIITREPYQSSFDKKNSRANWVEMVAGAKVNIWNNFYMGYTIRFKFSIYVKQNKEVETLDIPGFGLANRDRDKNINAGSNLGFSFNLMYRIPFGKDPIIPMKLR